MDVVDIPNALMELPSQVALLLWYPVASIINAILFFINTIYGSLAMLLNNIIEIGNLPIAYVQVVFSNLFPSIWVSIIVMIIIIIIALRIYSFLKGITIFGFRMGG